MKEIPLTQGKFAIVDDEDYERLSQHKWFAMKDTNTFYVARYDTEFKMIQMHRELLGLKKYEKRIVDHINRNGLDNRKNNLRIVNISLNSYNKRMLSNNSSGYRGVSWSKPHQQWVSRIGYKGKSIFCGRFNDIKKAAMAYDNKAKEIWGNNAMLNFTETT